MNSFLDSLSAENQLVIALCRLSFTAEHREYIDTLVGRVSSRNQFTIRANEHGVAALVCNNLEELGHMEKLPAREAAFLKNAYLKSLSRNTHLQEKLEEVKSHLAEIGLEPVLLKGMALELTAYGNMGLRQMNDIDLYIKREDCLGAWEHLKSKGYTQEPLKSPLHKKIILDIGKHLPELYSDGISIELHHKLFDSPPSSFVAYAKEDYPMLLAPCSLLPIEVHFLYLIKHLHYHETSKGESQLRLYNDLCQLMVQCTRDVKSSGILDLAKEYGLTGILLEKFYTLNLLWGMPLPGEMFKSLSTEQKKQAEEKIRKFINQAKGHKVSGKGSSYRKSIRAIPGFSNKLRYLIGDLFPSLSFMKARYGVESGIVAALFYPLRCGKLLLLLIK